MNKIIIAIISIVVTISAIFLAFSIMNSNNKVEEIEEHEEVSENEIYDECTDEYEMMQQETMKTNSEGEKVSPNASLTIKTYYRKCQHTTEQYLNIPENLVNLNKEEIQKKYPDCTIESFTSNEIVLYQEKEGECNEHYLVKDDNGLVTIYKILEDGSLNKEETTGISTEYLPQTDKIIMESGIKVNGKQDLNKLIEDFE